jgi:hypothetical protein
MASAKRRFCQSFPTFTPHCQKKNCPHQSCSDRGSSYQEHACPTIFWCSQCTRFWCDDCWGGVDAHEPLDVEVAGMIDHKKQATIKQVQTEVSGRAVPISPPYNWTVQEYNTQKTLMVQQDCVIQLAMLEKNSLTRSFMAWQEQRNGASPNPADHAEQDAPNSDQTEITKWTLQDYQMKKLRLDQKNYEIEKMLLKQQNRKRLLAAWEEHTKDALLIPGQTETQSRNMTPTTTSTIQDEQYHSMEKRDWQMRLMLLERQNKKRLMAVRNEHAKNASQNPAGQTEETQSRNTTPTMNEPLLGY